MYESTLLPLVLVTNGNNNVFITSFISIDDSPNAVTPNLF